MRFTKFAAVALFATLLMVGCAEEKLSFGNEGEENLSNKGFLSVSALTVDCRIDENDPELGLSARKATRNSADVADFECSIINENNEVVKSFKYSERPTEPIELETGGYIFKMQSGEVVAAAWDSPVYGAVKPFKIVRNETENLSQIICSLMQIKVSVSYDPKLLERLGPQTFTTVSVGKNSLEYTLTESRAGFFLAPQVSNTISLRIWGTYAADKVNFKNIEMTKEVPDVKAGQHSKVHFYLEHEAEGSIKIGVELRNWVTDEIITCNVADLVFEEEWIDEGNSGDNNEGGEVKEPITVEWVGYDISKRETIDSTTTGEIMIYASKGIKELIVHIDSPVLAPILSQVGLVDVINLTHLEKSYDSANPQQPLTDEQLASLETNLKPINDGGLLGFPYGGDIINKTEILFSITDFMGALAAFPGNHDFHFSITDNEGNTISPTLMLTSN